MVFVPAAEPEANFHQYSHVLTTVSSVACSCHISGIYSKWAKRLQLAQTTRSDGPQPCIKPTVSLPHERQTTNKWVMAAGSFLGGCAAVSWRALTIAAQTNVVWLLCNLFPAIKGFISCVYHRQNQFQKTSCFSNEYFPVKHREHHSYYMYRISLFREKQSRSATLLCQTQTAAQNWCSSFKYFMTLLVASVEWHYTNLMATDFLDRAQLLGSSFVRAELTTTVLGRCW